MKPKSGIERTSLLSDIFRIPSSVDRLDEFDGRRSPPLDAMATVLGFLAGEVAALFANSPFPVAFLNSLSN